MVRREAGGREGGSDDMPVPPPPPELDEYSPGCESPQLKHLLQRLQDLTDFLLVHHWQTQFGSYVCPPTPTQEPIPTVESFLMVLLEEWSGGDYQSEVLGLLSHLSLQPFGGMYIRVTSVCDDRYHAYTFAWDKLCALFTPH